MIVDYIKFKKLPLSSEIVLFFIHGNPRNISNELEHDILNFYKKLDYKQQTYVIDDDSQTDIINNSCLLYTSPSPRDRTRSRMPSSA